MKNIKLIIVILILLSALQQNSFCASYEYLFNTADTIVKDIGLYGGLTHQHHDFFNKAFSFQGIEAGFIFNHSLFLGLYASSFVSNLEVDLLNKKTYLSLAQAGIVLGIIYDSPKFIHTGLLLNAGFISIIGDYSDFALFNAKNPAISIGGFVMAPQVFAEVNILEWMKIRTGLAYNFYSYPDHSVITTDDLQNISFTFGFFFGRFQ